MEQKPKKWGLILVVLVVALIVIGGIYFLTSGKPKFISPIPTEPSFKVIYYTPTPGEATPTSTPSATPKVKPTATRAPTPTKAEATVTPKVSPTVTPKATATSTP